MNLTMIIMMTMTIIHTNKPSHTPNLTQTHYYIKPHTSTTATHTETLHPLPKKEQSSKKINTLTLNLN